MDWDSVDENDGGPTFMSLEATSNHPGGVNALFADGSVHFCKNTVSPVIWCAWARSPAARSSAPTSIDSLRGARSLRATPGRSASGPALESIMRISPRNGLLAALSCGVCWGCGPGREGTAPSLIPVKGKVTYKGQPLTKGADPFVPDGYGREAAGEIQVRRDLRPRDNKEGDGVVAGHHRVSISGTGNRPRQGAVPKKYAGPKTSKLTADVNAEHTEFTFDLE